MTLKARIHTELNRLASLAGTNSVPQLLRIDTGDGHVESELTTIDQLACAFNRFAYKTDKLANSTIDELKDVANSLSSQLGYLLESISPVEIDDEACVVQMRSNPPEKDDDGTRYYELVVARGELTLLRYCKPPGQPRAIVAANVTREVFERLGEDFVDTVA
ncbi:MAG: hypothetical protein CMJ64_23735 [Planctomycetaceae bacterium]|nr:hypothetical protein [Planctomycetaceae bacterium]